MKVYQSARPKGERLVIDLAELCNELRELPEISSKLAINIAASHVDLDSDSIYAQPGDDCAAIKTGDGYQLLAMEGMLPGFVKTDPKAAAWSSVMANVSDIAAMGGRATAIVNAYWHNNLEESNTLIKHIKRACKVFGVTFAGGHSSINESYTPGLAVSIIGYAKKLLSCHHVKPGQRLFLLSDLTGSWHGDLPYWGCVTNKTDEEIRSQWQIPAELAERELVVAAKDVSNGGILGTLIMMLELSNCGATLDLNAINLPASQPTSHSSHISSHNNTKKSKRELLRWLRAFQSFGFLLAVEPEKVSALIQYFQNSHLDCTPIGTVNDGGKIRLDFQSQQAEFWDLNKNTLTGMGKMYQQSNHSDSKELSNYACS